MQAFTTEVERTREQEWRTEPRFPVESMVRYRLDSGPYARAVVKDVSLHGMGLLLPVQLRLGVVIQVLYQHPSLGLSWVEGVVCHIQAGPGYFYTGIRLEFRSPSDRFPYQALVCTLQSPQYN